ncbi:RecB-like helicase [Arcobacter sp. CECT 9188]|uniref:RecB-like helicase n=1 Tax=Arcobacter sp. CECT 9188 TaxID=2044505 RepID=UPI000DE89672|nr:RecB-like helicase [Arcobacter sp. CECT 9188]RBQ26449.1 recombinase RecB [Arcobacter sp. CECT 9188]
MKRYLALKASAGSGKTFALTVRYISLLLKGANASEILTLTFTNKAALEMSQRIYKTLQTLGDDEAYLNELIRVSNFSKEEILGKKSFLIKSFSNSTISIFTIDKFVNKILREFCGYIGISDDFEIKNDDIELLSYRFLQSLDENSFKDLVDFSNYEKKKFNSIFELFKSLIEKNENINLIDIDSSLINLQKDIVFKQALKIKEHFINCSSASNSAIKAVDFTNFEELFEKTWIEKDSLFEYSYFKKCYNDEINQEFLKLKEEFKNYYKIRASYSLNKIFKLYLEFKEYKLNFNKIKNYFEFNDISNLVYELLNQKIDKDFLYFRLDSTYHHILIDEFQDTSILQYKILKPLIEEILSGDETKFKTFFYVGDPKQSIYRFRGGKRELFDFVLKTNPIIEIEHLNTNYRSCQNIIDFVNNAFLNLVNYDYKKQESIRKDGFVEVIQDEILQSEDKFSNIALKVNELIDNGINPNDIAILCYTNSDVLELFYYLKEKFPALKIKTDMTSKLISQQNVKALINAIKYIFFKEDIYKENFNALLGRNLLTHFEFEFDISQKSMSQILYKVAKYFDIFDENIVKLIDIAKNYNNIVDFVYEVDKLETSIENSEDNGLQILTIFKSKGLEFHTVIVLDRLKRKNFDKSSLLFDYENIELKNIFYKISGYEYFDLEYKTAQEKEKKLSLDDDKNVLYVALTRAKNNLIIFKKEKNSAFDILNLSECKIGNLIQSQSLNTEKKLDKVSYTPLYLGKQEQKIVNEKGVEENELLKARYIGLATHYVLEMMSDFTISSMLYAINLSKARYSNYLDEIDFVKIERIVKNLVENSFFQELLSNSKIVHEQALIYKEELKIVDLLLLKDNCFYIIDYKTTRQILDEHKTQVTYYKKAISDIFINQNVKAYLFYLKEDRLDILEV